MTDAILSRLASYLIGVKQRRTQVCDLYDRAADAVKREMQAQGLKELKRAEYTIKRVKIPTVACRSCGSVLPAPEGLPADYQAERLEIRKAKTHTPNTEKQE